MIDLTPQQIQMLQKEQEPFRVRDPQSQATFVLVPTETYERIQTLCHDDESAFVNNMYAQTMEVFGRDGWDDPAMDVYNELDPRRKP